MDQVYAIRHQVLVEGRSIRAVAREVGVSRNTVRRYLDGAPPAGRKPVARARPVLAGVRERLDALLTEAPRWTEGKQRLTATQVHRLLRDEGHRVGVTLVKAYVAEWKRRRREVYVPLVYRPGELAEVDFFAVLVDVAGRREHAWLFLLRLMYSGRDFAWLYARQDQVSFLDGHVRAFAHFGAVPQRLLYDNLTPAVARVLAGAERHLTARFTALAAHYVFEPCFARPGTGHDKGGVEGRGKGIRLAELVPIPTGPDLATISRALLARLDARLAQTRRADGRTTADRFAEEPAQMRPLPADAFRAAAVRWVRVSPRALVKVAGAQYSVPSAWAGLEVTAYLGPDAVEVVGSDGMTVRHPRQPFGGRAVDYRHYLRELARKPQAVRQVADVLVTDLGEPFGAVWRHLVEARGPREAARAFAQVLGAVEAQGASAVAARLAHALAHGEPVLLALRAPTPVAPLSPDALLAGLAELEVPAGRAADYDALLGGRP